MNIVDESPIDNVTLKVTDGEDREWNEDNVPNPLRRVIEKSLRKGQLDGTVAAAGRLFRCHAVLGDQVSLQFTRHDRVEREIPIPATGWYAFQQLAARRGVDPRQWLVAILGNEMSDGISLEDAVRWLFPSKSEEMQRFEQAQHAFHRRFE
ncbi:MAG TPA: hypothetical protein VFO90_02560 [Terrimicrobiaceae bacterium]|jgi:hypothetical protein|nr:hypothetical protein [Terrimicrobiaceae bacterium]